MKVQSVGVPGAVIALASVTPSGWLMLPLPFALLGALGLCSRARWRSSAGHQRQFSRRSVLGGSQSIVCTTSPDAVCRNRPSVIQFA
jgi:hypothetical protein